MAVIIDSHRPYLEANILKIKNRAKQIALVVFLLSGFTWAYIADMLWGGIGTTRPLLAFLGFIAVYVLIIALLFKWLGKKQVEIRRWQSGRQAEVTAGQLLAALPDDYIILADVVLPGKGGNLDFIVVGTHAVVCVEVKGHKGSMDIIQGKVVKGGKRLDSKDVLRQVKMGSVNLQKFLQRKLQTSIAVKPVIFFTHPEVSSSKDGQSIEGVGICTRQTYNQMLTGIFLSPVPLPTKSITEVLKPFIGA